MIEIKDNIIELSKEEHSKYTLDVISQRDNGNKSPFAVDLVSNTNVISANVIGSNMLNIEIDTPNVLNEEYIILKNMQGDRTKITILPNKYYTMEKKYKFKITKKTYEDDGSLKIKIISKMNDEEIGLDCTYDGKPMEYYINPRHSDNGEYVTIIPAVKVVSNFTTMLEFTQRGSGNVIRLEVYNTPEGIKKKED
jgi:hypothetical protein